MSQSRIPYDVCATNEQQKQSEGPGNRQLDHPTQRNIMSHSVPAGIDNVHFVDEFSVFQDRIQMESELLTIGNKIQRCVPANGGNNRPTMHNSKAPFQKVESHRFLVPTDNPKEKSQFLCKYYMIKYIINHNYLYTVLRFFQRWVPVERKRNLSAKQASL